MKVIRRIDPETVIALDIETVRIKKDWNELPKDYIEAWEYKNKHEGEIPDNEELAKEWEKRSSLYAEFSKVCAVSLTLYYKGQLKVKNYASEDETMLLLSLKTDLDKFHEKGRILCAHAGKYFDYPFLAKRYIINRIAIPELLDSSHLKPWEHTNLDTNDLWKSFGTGPGSSLIALAACLGLPISKVDLVGDEVGKVYYNGEIQRIADYCALDAITCMNVFLVFKGLNHFSFEDVVCVNKGEVIPPLLTGLHEKKKLSELDRTALQHYCKSLGVSEIEKVRDIVHAAIHVNGALDLDTKNFLETL